MCNSPLVSVIVPVYKVERYLPRCIESILRQTYTNFELILVDDGTPDRSGIICDRYAEKDSRIKVIHKENGGVSSARNDGIDVAQGEWITFVDSDDWVSDNYLKTLLGHFNEKHDLMVGTLEWRSTRIQKNGITECCISVDDCNSYEKLSVMFFGIEFAGPCMKLFSKRIINKNNLRFERDFKIAEDAVFVMNYLKHCKSICVKNEVVYYYNRLNEFSVTKQYKYFEERTKWYLQYIKKCLEVLHTFGADKMCINNIITNKALLLYKFDAISIINTFSEFESKEKIEEIAHYYKEYIVIGCDWINNQNNVEYKKLSTSIFENNVNVLYNMLKSKSQNSVVHKFKQIIKKAICPLIEKYRDGLVKFKF